MVERHGYSLAVDHGQAETIVLRSPGHHVAAAHVKGSLTVPVGLVSSHRIVFAVIIDLELHTGPGHRLAGRIHDRHDAAPGRHIAADDIDFRIAGSPPDNVFIAVIVAEYFRMQDQRPGHGAGKPGHIEPGFRFAGAHELPFPVHIDLHPGVIVVGVGPARRIDLPGRDTCRTERRHGQHRFFTAAAYATPDGLQRGRGTAVRRLVGCHSVAPVVDFQGRFFQGHPLYAGAERIGIQGPEIVERLVVDPQRQHKVPEFPLGNVPIHFFPDFQCFLYIGQPEVQRMRRQVRMRHRGIEEIDIRVRFAARLARTGSQKQDGRQQHGQESGAFHCHGN